MRDVSRQINKDIFSEDYIPPAAALTEDTLSFDGPMEAPHYDELNSSLEKFKYDVQEWLKTLNLRIEKVAQKVQSLEERMKVASHDTHDKMATLYSKIKENQNSELKFAALIERHNQIVQSFELRLNQSHRLIENQSLQLAKQQELIDDARRQIERLKKL